MEIAGRRRLGTSVRRTSVRSHAPTRGSSAAAALLLRVPAVAPADGVVELHLVAHRVPHVLRGDAVGQRRRRRCARRRRAARGPRRASGRSPRRRSPRPPARTRSASPHQPATPQPPPTPHAWAPVVSVAAPGAVSPPGGTMTCVPFSEPTRAWFDGAFAAPTPAQEGAWDAIALGQHALVVAPTGSGKTLAAFLWAIDQMLTGRGARGRRALPGALRLPAQGPGRRRRAQPPLAAGRHLGRRGPAGPAGQRRPGGHAHRRHPGQRARAGWPPTRPTSSSPPPSRSTSC